MRGHIEGVLWVVSFGCLWAAALTSPKVYLPVIAAVWLLSTVTVIPLHFVKAWRKLGTVPNKRQYAAWVGFESACTLALVGGFVYALFSR